MTSCQLYPYKVRLERYVYSHPCVNNIPYLYLVNSLCKVCWNPYSPLFPFRIRKTFVGGFLSHNYYGFLSWNPKNKNWAQPQVFLLAPLHIFTICWFAFFLIDMLYKSIPSIRFLSFTEMIFLNPLSLKRIVIRRKNKKFESQIILYERFATWKFLITTPVSMEEIRIEIPITFSSRGILIRMIFSNIFGCMIRIFFCWWIFAQSWYRRALPNRATPSQVHFVFQGLIKKAFTMDFISICTFSKMN